MPQNINMENVYEFMQPVWDAMNKVYDYVVEFTDGMISSLQNVIAVIG